jgi:hypothetical protein
MFGRHTALLAEYSLLDKARKAYPETTRDRVGRAQKRARLEKHPAVLVALQA